MWRLSNRYFFSKILNQVQFHIRKPFENRLLYNKSFKTRFQKNDGKKYFHETINTSMSDGFFKHKQGFIPSKVLRELDVQGVSLNEDKNILRLVFEGGEKLDFPIIWLRDNCQCPNCFDITSHSRIVDQQILKNNTPPQSIAATKSNVIITWEDGHKSDYSKKWLCEHSFVEEHQNERSKKRHLDPISWNSEEFEKNKNYFRFVFSDLLHNDLTLLNWLEQLAKYGFSIITDTPKTSGQLERLAQRIAFIRKTHYGEQFSVTGSDDAENVAYKKGALQLHTDLPYYHFMPGIVMLHCINPSMEGGENILSDGLNAASQLSVKTFQVLSETIVEWVDIGSHENKRFYSINREPVLCLDRFGKLNKINWSQPQRDSVFNVSVEEAIEWYGAAAEFSQIIHDPRNAVTFKSQIGDILTFDNRRILHGRKNYTDANRLLYGAYIDWDEIYSRIRVLQNELKPENH